MAQEWFYIVPPEETVEKGGKGSGWFAPPKGTHGKGKKLDIGAGQPLSAKDAARAVSAFRRGEGKLVSSERNVSADVFDVGNMVVKKPKHSNEYVWVEYGGAQEIASGDLSFIPATRYFFSKKTGPLIVQRKVIAGPSKTSPKKSMEDLKKEAKKHGYNPKDLRWGNIVVDTKGNPWVIDIDMWDFPPTVLRRGRDLRKKRHKEAIG